MYPEEPDYEGLHNIPEPLTQSIAQVTDKSKPLHRVVFANLQQRLEKSDLIPRNADHVLRNGQIICNL